MRRGVLNAGSYILTRNGILRYSTYSTAVSQKPAHAEKPKRTLAERLQRKSSRSFISPSKEVIARKQVINLIPASLYGAEGQIGDAQSGWKSEEWKDDWGSDSEFAVFASDPYKR
jgi:hypothetical protein